VSAQASSSDRGGVLWDEHNQPHCPNCDQSLRHEERTQEATANGHHNSVFRCSTCDIEVLSG